MKHPFGHGGGRRHRHRGGREHPFFGKFEDGFPGGMPRGRKLSSEDLQLVLLALIEEQPRHGYELIRELEQRSSGFYVPSPGVIYPALTYLDEIGLAEAQQDGKRKCYTLTEQGRAHLDERRDKATAILEAFGTIAERMDNVRAAFSGKDELDPAIQEKFDALRDIKQVLRAKRHCPPEEARRIAEILKRATAEIRGEEV